MDYKFWAVFCAALVTLGLLVAWLSDDVNGLALKRKNNYYAAVCVMNAGVPVTTYYGEFACVSPLK